MALKKLRLENERDGFPLTVVREIKILRQLSHPNVVALLNVVSDRYQCKETNTAKGVGLLCSLFLTFCFFTKQ